MKYCIHPRREDAQRICDAAGRLLAFIEYKDWCDQVATPFSDLSRSGELIIQGQTFHFIAFSNKRTQEVVGAEFETGVVLYKDDVKICDMDGQFALDGIVHFANQKLIFEGKNWLALVFGFDVSSAFTLKDKEDKKFAHFKPGRLFQKISQIDIVDTASLEVVVAALILAVCAPLITTVPMSS